MVNFYLEENHFVFELNNENNDLQRFYTPEYFEFLGIEIEILSNNIPKMYGGSREGTELTFPYKYFANFIDGNMNFTADTKRQEGEETVEDSESPTYMNESAMSIEDSVIEPVEDDSVIEPVEEDSVIEPVEEDPVIETVEEDPVIETVEEDLVIEPVKEDPGIEPAEENSVVENVVVVKNVLILKIEIDDDNKTFNGILRDIMKSNKEKNEDNIQLNTDGLFYEDIERIYIIKNYLNTDVFLDDVFRINGKFIIIKENSTEPTDNISKLDVSMMNNTFLTNKLRK
jgi:hypothetical protein